MLTLGTATACGDVTVVATDAGFVTAMGGSAKGDGTVVASATYNYSVGRELHYATGALGAPLMPMERRNYFVFDLTGVTDTITSGSLLLFAGVYESVDPTEAFALRPISDQIGALADADALGAPGTVPGDFDSPADPLVGMAAALFTKIPPFPGPPMLGGAMISAGMDGTIISIALTPEGVGFLNSHLGERVILGGTCPTAEPGPGHPPPDSPQQPFGFTGVDIPGGSPLAPKLSLTTVPAPGAAGLLLALGLTAARRRR